MPVVTTLHTRAGQADAGPTRVMSQIINASAKIVVMAEKGHELLRSVHTCRLQDRDHSARNTRLSVSEPHHAKAKLGFDGKTILTFGLLSPSKGIETVIDAMPEIIKSCPNAIYVILGATHPNLVRTSG